MKKLGLRLALSAFGGVVLGLLIASWFEVHNEKAYFAVVTIFGLLGAAIGGWVFPGKKG
ncbi:MAG: hypothetical protein AB3N15_12040 [Paracoccaceae bacterium]